MINMVFGCREQGKTFKSLYLGLDVLIANCPNQKRFTICCLESVYDQLRNLPEAYFRGRWLYIDYKGTTTFVKKVKVKRPEHSKIYNVTYIKDTCLQSYPRPLSIGISVTYDDRSVVKVASLEKDDEKDNS